MSTLRPPTRPPASGQGSRLDLLRRPQRRARTWLVEASGRSWTFGQVAERVQRTARYIESRVRPGGRVAIWGENSVEWIVTDLATAAAGCVSVPILPKIHVEDATHILEHCDVELAFVQSEMQYDTVISTGRPTFVWGEDRLEDSSAASRRRSLPAEVETVVFTSGSTGRPKGARHPASHLVRAARDGALRLGVNEQDRMFSHMSFAHVFERWLVLGGSLAAGCPLHLARGDLRESLLRVRPTRFQAVPRILQRLGPEVDRSGPAAAGLDRVRTVVVGGAPLPPSLFSGLRDRGIELLQGYGMTENFAHSHLSHPDSVVPGTVGPPLPGVECRIVEGEIRVRSPCNFLGYHDDPTSTAQAFDDAGFLRTGDAGRIDPAGHLTVEGRLRDPFKTLKGKWVDPIRLENAIRTWPEVASACVIGEGRSQPTAVVVISPEAPRAGLWKILDAHRRQLNGRLLPHERIQWVAARFEPWSIEEGTLTPTGKIRRGVVHRVLASRLPSDGAGAIALGPFPSASAPHAAAELRPHVTPA
jgi:long-chain acyl-CoA synthetase